MPRVLKADNSIKANTVYVQYEKKLMQVCSQLEEEAASLPRSVDVASRNSHEKEPKRQRKSGNIEGLMEISYSCNLLLATCWYIARVVYQELFSRLTVVSLEL